MRFRSPGFVHPGSDWQRVQESFPIQPSPLAPTSMVGWPRAGPCRALAPKLSAGSAGIPLPSPTQLSVPGTLAPNWKRTWLFRPRGQTLTASRSRRPCMRPAASLSEGFPKLCWDYCPLPDHLLPQAGWEWRIEQVPSKGDI